jgi:hypothetical protein
MGCFFALLRSIENFPPLVYSSEIFYVPSLMVEHYTRLENFHFRALCSTQRIMSLSSQESLLTLNIEPNCDVDVCEGGYG